MNVIKRLTQEEFVERVNDSNKEKYVVLGIYTTSRTKVRVKHKKCGKTWDAIPANLMRGHGGCPYCYGTRMRTQAEFEKDVFDMLGSDYKVLGKYMGRFKKLIFCI